MKNYRYLLGALLLLGLCACEKQLEEEFISAPGKNTLKATISSGPASKTTLSPSGTGVYKVLWSEEDAIGVFVNDAEDPALFLLENGAGTKNGTFSGYGYGSRYVAFYPYDQVQSRNGNSLTAEFPTEQPYATGSFGEEAFPMVAAGTSAELTFRNVASVLKLTLKGPQVVTRLVFRPKDSGIKVSGPYTLSLDDPENPEMTFGSDGVDSLAVNTGGVALSPDSGTDLYLVLPAQTYKGGFSVRIYTTTGYMDKTYGADFTMERSQVHPSGEITVKLDSGVDVSAFLRGEGTEENPFLVETLSDLLLMQAAVNANGTIRSESAQLVNAGNACYLLQEDINFGSVCGETGGKSWVPIGCDEYHFAGTFDGNGHTLSGLYIDTDLSDQGLFGVIEGAAVISNLTVRGQIQTSGNYVGLIAGRYESYASYSLQNCLTEGSVSGASYVGGQVGGGRYLQPLNCVNRADVNGSSYVGGIAGLSYWGAKGCINHGSIAGSRNVAGILGCGDGLYDCKNDGKVSGGSYAGGIVGYQNSSALFNCRNEGEISGNTNVGGVSGYSRQYSYVWNNINRGSVSGENNVGGICGWLSSNSGESSLRNCLNLGEVSQTGSDGSAGAICGRNEGPYEYSNAAACTAEQNYWLYDAASGAGMAAGIGIDEGESSSLFTLTLAQMKGESYGSVLYGGYDTVVDALNAWAYASSAKTNLQGWKYDESEGLPALTGITVQAPGSEQSVFSVDITQADALASGDEVVVTVTSSQDYSVETPDWISRTGVQEFEADPYKKIYTFAVESNSGSLRKGTIAFTGIDGKTLAVTVTQKAPSLTVDVAELLLSANGGTKRVVVSGTLAWEASSDADWCVVSPRSGGGDGLVTVKASQNTGDAVRTATVTVSSREGSFRHTITVVQSANKPGEEGDWKELDFIHQSLMMRFTATWCGWCPRMNASVKAAQAQYPDKILHLALHGGGSDLQFANVGPLMTQYSISGFPTGVVDGRITINNYDTDYTAGLIVAAVKETESTYGTRTGVDITSSVSGRTVSVDVNAYVKQAGDYKITVLLVEDNIVNAQTDYENGNQAKYVHDAVARVSLTDVQGDAFTAAEDYTVTPFHYSATVSSSYSLDNMRVLVYIQRAFGDDSVIQSDNFGDYFVDNAATIEVGSSLRLALEGGAGGNGGGNEGITPGGDIEM